MTKHLVRKATTLTASVWFLIPGSAHYTSAYITLAGTFRATSSGISWNIQASSEPHDDLRSYSRLGHGYGVRRWKTTGANGSLTHQRIHIDGVDLPFGDIQSEGAYSLAISDLGHTVASIRHDDSSFDGYHLCAPGGTAERLSSLTESMYPLGVNDQKWVVGNMGQHEAVRGDLGFVLVNGVALRTFHDLLPVEYRKQLRSAIPTMVTNVIQPGGKPRILFSAENYEETPGKWVPRTLVLSWDASGQPVVERLMLPAVVVNPVTHVVEEFAPAFAAWNKQRDFAALVFPPANVGGTPYPAILRPCPFQASKPFSEGFDPPLVGDVDPATLQRDEEDWVPWTSVAKSGPPALNINKRTKLLFPPGSPYWQHDIIAADDDGIPYSSPQYALAFVDEHTPYGEDTPLTIHGLPGGNSTAILQATILVRMNDSTHQVVWRMKVMVLPPSKSIGLAFYNEPATNTGIATPANIEKEINDRFEPAAVNVVATHAAWEGNPATHHDGDCTFVLVDHISGGKGTDRGICHRPERAILLSHIYFSAFANNGPEDDEGVIDTMSRTAAHEFGHFLTLSTRGKNYTPLNPFGHDDELGFYGKHKYPPIKPNKTVQALMRSGDQVKGTLRPPGRWIRHEDWRAANKEALRIKP